MSWLKAIGIGLDIADAYIAEQNAKKLKELQMQGAAIALIEALIKELRNQIFNFKQTAEEILANESETPVIAAGAMKLLERRLLESGITPEVFQEITDKEYTATVIRLIRENSDRMLRGLSKEEQAEINHIASVASRLQDYEFYVENYQKGKDLQKATEVIKTYKNRQGCLPIIGLILYFYPGIAFPFLFAVMLGGRSEAGQSIVGFIGLGLWAWGLIGILKWKNGGGYKDANNAIQKHGENFNLDYFNSLEKELGDVQEIKKLRNEARRIAGKFFGESSLFQISPYNIEEDSTSEHPASISVEEGVSVEPFVQVAPYKIDTWSAQHISLEGNPKLDVEDDSELSQSIDHANPALPENQKTDSNFDFENIKNSAIEKLTASFGKLNSLFAILIEKLMAVKISLPNFKTNKKQIIWGGAIVSVFVIVLIIVGTIKNSLSNLPPIPTQDNGAMFTQAFETAFAALITSTPAVQSTASPTEILATSTQISTNTPLVTNTPKPPSYEIGITSCEITTSNAYSGWSIYDCIFWVQNNTNQTITFGDFLTRNDEELKNSYFYEQGDYLKPINNGEAGVHISTIENSSYPVDFISYADTGSTLDIQPLRPYIPVRGFEAGISGGGTFNLHFLIPNTMTPSFINFQKIGVKVNVPQQGIIQSVPTPKANTTSVFDYNINNDQISLTFREFNIVDDFGKIYFTITFDATNKNTGAQTSSEISFPYFIVDSNGMSYDDVGRGGDKIVEIGPYSVRLGPGQKDELVMKFRIQSIPQFIYIIPINSNMPIVLIDTQNPQSVPIATVEANSNNGSDFIQCGDFTSRLQPNMEAKVLTDAINMREKPGTNQTIVGIIYAEDKVQLTSEPPICGDGYLWWKVLAIKSGITGWVVEGVAGEQWLSP